MKAKYLVEGRTKISKLNREHEFCYRYADDIIATMTEDERIKAVAELPLTVTIEVYAESVSEAESVAKNSCDPIFELDIHTIQRL